MLRLLEPGQRVIIPDDAYGGTFRLVSKVLAPAGIEWTVADLTDVDALGTRLARRHRARLGRDAHQPRAHHRRHPRRVRGRARARRARRRRQHVRHAVPAAAARAAVPTSWCTRPRSTSAATPTSSAGSRPPTIPRSPSASGSCRTRSARCRARSTATSCCAGIKTLAVRMERHCHNAQAVATLLLVHPAVSSRPLPGHPDPSRPRRSRDARCATSAGW